jgi:hypothetical protein
LSSSYLTINDTFISWGLPKDVKKVNWDDIHYVSEFISAHSQEYEFKLKSSKALEGLPTVDVRSYKIDRTSFCHLIQSAAKKNDFTFNLEKDEV